VEWLAPMTSLFSPSSTSNGDDTDSQPPSGPDALLARAKITDAVVPGVTRTFRSLEPLSFDTVTTCSSAAKSATTIGDRPRERPSIETFAPGGSVTIDRRPDGAAATRVFSS